LENETLTLISQGEVGSGVAHYLRGEVVEEMCGGVHGLCPIAGRERLLKKEATDHAAGVRMMCSARPFWGEV
jgi:hypothetical protein